MRSPAKLPPPLIHFDTPDVNLALVGGKGINLARIFQAGFSVPDGFIIPTTSYQEFVEDNDLDIKISSILSNLDHASPTTLEAASKHIRNLFTEREVIPALEEAIAKGWWTLGERPVAVRSSATAEDLPEMSFAGQQDTFLNVASLAGILEATIQCWSSMWTARAIGYRYRNEIPHQEVSLSVIIQVMVESEASGVMFTANPLTGLRREVVIDATIGLGEAMVSGQVEPDHYTVDLAIGTITEKRLGAKSFVLRGQDGGGMAASEEDKSSIQALPDEAILQLAESGKKIQELYEFPQDIEWAWKNDQLFILQSRPITSLYPIPAREDSPFLRTYFSFGAVQGLLSPITPLGQDAIRLIFSGGASLFGFDHDHRSQQVIWSAGERLWGDITAILRHPIGAKLILKLFPGVEPGSVEALKTVLADPAIEGGTGKIRLKTLRRIIKFYRRLLRNARKQFRNPEESAVLIRKRYETELTKLINQYSLESLEQLPLTQLPGLFKEIRNSFIFVIPEVVPGAMVGLVPMIILNRFSKKLTRSGELALEVTRGLPNNVTTEMDIILWKTAQAIKSDADSFAVISSGSPELLAEDYLKGKLPRLAQEKLADFLAIYGMRGLGEIDFGRPRWRENPAPVLQTIQSYFKIKDREYAPDMVFERGAKSAADAVDKLEALALKTFGGKLKGKIIRGSARRLRALAGLRESPKFYIVQKFGYIRNAFLYHGEELVRKGQLGQRDDLIYLTLDELENFVHGEGADWNTMIEERRQTFNREMRRKQIPRILVSDGRAFYDGIGSADGNQDQFNGSPVSPGVVEGSVRVVMDPHDANLLPGEILVCPGTDPAWTPLFLVAGGLVMEVGGLMTHGAIVAREYGIPAVVGVNSATEILKTGDRIRIDGSTGAIERL